MTNQRNTDVSYLFGGSPTQTEEETDLFTRPTRAEQRGTVLPAPMPVGVATVSIICAVCGVREDMPIVWGGKLCRHCRADLPATQERVFTAWEHASATCDDTTMNRFIAIQHARQMTRDDRMRDFLKLVRKGEDERKLGDDKRTQAILKDVAAGLDDTQVIAAAQARVQKGIDKARSDDTALDTLLRAEETYQIAMREIEAAGLL